jgi:protein-L-isoaspartate(D-aspartate) O-methyltransferase
MTDYESARKNMLEGQVRTNDVSDQKLQAAIMDVPRERFVATARRSLAYSDDSIEITDERYLMRPRAFSKLMQAARVSGSDMALVIGCSSGYAAAVMGKLAESVIALESDEALAAQATTTLGELEIDNVAVVTGALADGLADQGPYDVIFVDGALGARSPDLESQLAEGGRLVVVLQTGPIGQACVVTRNNDNFAAVEVFDANVAPLPGFERESEFVF